MTDRLEVRGEDRKIYLQEDGKIAVSYDFISGGAPFYYDNEDDFRKDLDIFVRFGRMLDLNADAVVI